MSKMLAILTMLVDCLRLFLTIELQIYHKQINVIIYNEGKEVIDFESFKWRTTEQKSAAFKNAINWLLKFAFNTINETEFNQIIHQ